MVVVFSHQARMQSTAQKVLSPYSSETQLPRDNKKGAALIFMTFLTLLHTPAPLAHRHTLPSHQLVLSASSLPWHLVESRLSKLITTAPPDITTRSVTAEIYKICSSHLILLSQVSLLYTKLLGWVSPPPCCVGGGEDYCQDLVRI